MVEPIQPLISAAAPAGDLRMVLVQSADCTAAMLSPHTQGRTETCQHQQVNDRGALTVHAFNSEGGAEARHRFNTELNFFSEYPKGNT